jgi:hypothetical protein
MHKVTRCAALEVLILDDGAGSSCTGKKTAGIGHVPLVRGAA